VRKTKPRCADSLTVRVAVLIDEELGRSAENPAMFAGAALDVFKVEPAKGQPAVSNLPTLSHAAPWRVEPPKAQENVALACWPKQMSDYLRGWR